MSTKLIAALLAAGIAVGGGAAWYTSAGTTSAAVQPVSFAGDAPFTSPVGTDDPDVAGSGASGPQDGTAAGSVASTVPAACDGSQLVEALQADPAKAGAWAQVEGIAPADIPAYVGSLSPAVLRADTAVTDHGFRDGKFTEGPAVLATGTAVMVSSYGQPTVKCFNGDPLTPPAQGTQVPAGAVIITPSNTPVATIVFSSPDGGHQYPHPAPRPVGPTPVQIAKAQLAREAADRDARKAVALRTVANTTAAAAKTADTKAAADADALGKANAALALSNASLTGITNRINQLQFLANLPFGGLSPAQKAELIKLQTVDLPAAVKDVQDKTTVRDTAKTTADASKADSDAKDKAAADAAKAADDQQTKAEESEAAAEKAEKKAGLPTPDESQQEGAAKVQNDLAKVTDDAVKAGTATKEFDTKNLLADPTATTGTTGTGTTATTGTTGTATEGTAPVTGTDPATLPLPAGTTGTTTTAPATTGGTTGPATTGGTDSSTGSTSSSSGSGSSSTGSSSSNGGAQSGQ